MHMRIVCGLDCLTESASIGGLHHAYAPCAAFSYCPHILHTYIAGKFLLHEEIMPRPGHELQLAFWVNQIQGEANFKQISGFLVFALFIVSLLLLF